MDTQELRQSLEGRHVATISKETRLSRQTIYTFKKDAAAKATPATIKLLSDWLAMDDKRQAAKARVRVK